ncbi:uncharacterized protein LOC118514484 [Anopheles stephensi]|uniref:uncharacterized protein LOC118514484 n=1 Tax=Anopheles stephensi TaxID=30069 RepID=UPI00165882C0|nr:uncharacterized protein LOC118514484 [Anopheles stephensi]
MVVLQHLKCTNDIRQHATIVGVVQIFGVISYAVLCAVWYHNDTKDLSEDIKTILMYSFIAVVIATTLMTCVYWIGFLKRKRWCLTVVIVLLFIGIPLQFLSIFGAIAQKDVTNVFAQLLQLAIAIYMLSVTRKLRKVYLEDELANYVLNEQPRMQRAKNDHEEIA